MKTEIISVLKNKIESKYVIRCVLENLIIFLVFLAIGVRFETNDDVGMEFIVAGVYGEPSPYMVYTNYIIGLVLSNLYKIIPLIKWYVLLDYVILFVDFCVITYVIDNRLSKSVAQLIKYPFLIVMGYEIYANLQFMKVAAFTATAGYMLFLLVIEELFDESEIQKAKLFVSISLIVVGSMIRIDVFVLSVPFFFLVFIEMVVKNYREKLCVKRSLCYITIPFILVLATVAVNKGAYILNPQWSEYKEWEETRSNAVDYALPEYWEATEEYEALGLNASDFYMLRGWMYGDPDFFTVELMKDVSNVKYPKEHISIIDTIKGFIDVIAGRFSERVFQFALYVLMVYIVMGDRKWLENSVILMAFLAVIFVLAYCYGLGKIVNRVNVSLWISLVMTMIFSFGKTGRIEHGDRRYIALVIMLFIIISIPTYISIHKSIKEKNNNNRSYKERTLFVAEDADRLYINDIGKNMFEIGWSGVFDKLPYGTNFGNVVDTASWLVASPIWYSAMYRKGVENIFRDTLDKDVVYIFIDSRVSSFETYIHEHYHPDAKYVKFREFSDGIGYYKLVSETNKNALDSIDYVRSDDLSEIYSFVSVTDSDDSLSISGMAYQNEKSSYYQTVYVVVKDKSSKQSYSFEAIRKEVPDRIDDVHGKYGDFEINIDKSELEFENYDINVLLFAEGVLYSIPIDEYNTEVLK